MVAKAVFAQLAAAALACALVNAFHIEPKTAALSGRADPRPDHGVAQLLTCCWDELDSASGSYVELFTGFHLGSGAYNLDITEYPDGPTIARERDVAPGRDNSWLRFGHIQMEQGQSFTKGKKYLFHFWRWGQDSLEYYYTNASGYNYGGMIAPYPGAVTPTHGLAMRCYGRMRPVDSTWLSVQIHSFAPDTGHLYPALRLAYDSLRARWLGDDLGHWDRWLWDKATIRRHCSTYAAMGFQVRGFLAYGSSIDSQSSRGPNDTFSLSSYPPRGLFAPLDDDTNYWADYCQGIMDTLDAVKCFAVWGEPNADWNWHDPDIAYYWGHTQGFRGDTWIDTPRERCSLYVRMCYIAKQTAITLGHGQKIVGGYVWRLRTWGYNDSTGDTATCTGASWLQHMFDLAEKRYGGVENCFDVVGVDPYMDSVLLGADRLEFDQGRFDADLDTARILMRAAGHADMELWVTEIGWPRWDYWKDTQGVGHTRPLTDTLMQARNLCQFLVSALARRADPRGGYDRVNWYELTAYRGDPAADSATEGLGLLDATADQKPLSQAWAAKQVDSILRSKRLNGRVMTGNASTDSLVRMYEFEDTTAQKKRTWVCWRNETATPGSEVPARSDTLTLDSLAYGSLQQAETLNADPDGWLPQTLAARPVFITERGGVSRPDLVVDSVRYIPPQDSIAVRAWVTNRGNRSTPVQDGGQLYPTRAVLHANGDSVAQQVYIDSIAVDEQVLFEFSRPVAAPDTALLSVQVNPGQSYVELSTDDNAGHTLKTQ